MAYESRYWRRFTRQVDLASKYIFYERLWEDGQYFKRRNQEKKGEELLTIYENVQKNISDFKGEVHDIRYGVSGLESLAEREYDKEVGLLREVFGVNIPEDSLKTVEGTREFIEAFNTCLQTKAVFERNRELLLDGRNTKQIISYFPTYFAQAFEEKWNNSAAQELANGVVNEVGLENVINSWIPGVLTRAVEIMFTKAKSELGQEQYDDAYKELIQFIGSVEDKNSFISQLFDIYGMKTFAKDLAKELKEGGFGSKQKRKVHNDIYGKANQIVSVNMPQKGGLAAEALAALMGQALSSVVGKNGVTVTAKRTGQTGIKTDFMISFGIDTQPIDEILNSIGTTSREANIEAFEKINEYLKGLDDRYIVYGNAKNYLPSTISSSGFSAGDKLTAENLIPVLQKIDKNANTLVGALLNTGEGAVGANPELKDALVHTLMGDIAIMLVDDYETVGDKARKGAKAVHLLDLNGIYIPTSFFLQLCAKAIVKTTKEAEEVIKVTISAPEIRFKTREEQSKWMNKNPGKSPWGAQKKFALKRTKVSYSFLKNFKALIETYLGQEKN